MRRVSLYLKYLKIFKVFILINLFVLCLNTCAFAAAAATSYGLDATLDYVQNITSSGMMDTVLQYARSLFIGLASVSLAFGLIRMLLNGESNLGTAAALIAKWTIYTGVFSWIMSNNIPQTVINSFVAIGGKIVDQSNMAPDDILSAGIRMYGTIVEQSWNAGWGDFVGITFVGLIILVVIAMIAATFALALIEMHLVICGGAVLLGFGGFEYTRDIALSYIRYTISVGFKLIMIMIIYGVASNSIVAWESQFSSAADMSTLITTSGQILGGVICLFMAARYIPNVAQSIVNRAGMTFGAPAGQVVYTSVIGAGSDSGATIYRESREGGLIRSFMDSMLGLRGGGQTGAVNSGAVPVNEDYVNREYVRGEDGMLSGAGNRPFRESQAAPQVQNSENAEAMTNYTSVPRENNI